MPLHATERDEARTSPMQIEIDIKDGDRPRAASMEGDYDHLR